MLWFPWSRHGPADRSPQDLLRLIQANDITTLEARVTALEAIAHPESDFGTTDMGIIMSPCWCLPGYSRNAVGTANLAAINRTVYGPFWVRNEMSFDALGCHCTTGGAAGSAVLMGLYSSNETTGLPNARLEVSGSISTTGTGEKVYTFPERTLTPGLYWTGFINLVAIATFAVEAETDRWVTGQYSSVNSAMLTTPQVDGQTTLNNPATAPTIVVSVLHSTFVLLRRTA
jgi:hypothetical protein